MKRSVYNKISTVVLWLCALVTLILSVWFYADYSTLDAESPELSFLLYWLSSLLVITISTGLIFSFIYYIRQWKETPKKMIRPIAVIFTWGFLLLITWLFGDGNPLSLIGYGGKENTYFWLKITDMWLYSIYFLLILAIFALFGGIIWSYFKKLN